MLPTSWRPDPGRLLPADPTRYHGPAVALWFTALYLTVIIARSLVHLVAPDGGAESIATIDIGVEGGDNLVALFGQWGAIQLLLAGLLVVLVARYRGLVPLVLATLLVEPGLRALSGALKPIETTGTAPGAALNHLVIPVIAVALWLSLCPAEREPARPSVRR
jgi:hypothetical protein